MTDDFFAGFLAALRLRGEEVVDTRNNVQHEQFRQVARLLETFRRDGAPGAAELPRLFRPAMATGLYGELDDALLQLQEGFGNSPNPSYLGLKLDLSQEQARDVLEEFSPDARKLLDQLAQAFIDAKTAARRQPEFV